MGAARLCLLVLALAVLAACGREQVPSASSATPATAGGSYPDGLACVAALASRGIAFRKLDDFEHASGCSMTTAVQVSGFTATLNAPIQLNCSTAFAFSEYETRVLQPAAQSLFGQAIVGIDTFGAYACRNRSGGGGRLSEHALGRAIDISAFRLADGRVIRVDRDWRAGGAPQTFLRRVAREACDVFNLVLSPNADASHWDHFHLDLGRWRLCQV